jgi:hypothetical protein
MAHGGDGGHGVFNTGLTGDTEQDAKELATQSKSCHEWQPL